MSHPIPGEGPLPAQASAAGPTYAEAEAVLEQLARAGGGATPRPGGAAALSRLETRYRTLLEQIPPAPLRLEADPVRLEQVLANLLNNAAKYTDPGGHVTLSAGPEGGAAALRVRDTGIGISPEMIERVFDLFTQVNRSLDRSAQWGLGIGLALVRSLVELHGGRVEAHSAGLGRGSEFVVRLPLLPLGPADRAAPGEDVPAPARRGGRTVLVVDDNPDMAESLALLLRAWGHEVLVAHDGLAALAAARAFLPEVVLLDLGLPGLDGYQVAEQLRQHEGPRKALLIALTGYGQEEDRRRSRQSGFAHHLVKPVDPLELAALVAGAAREPT